MKPTKTSITAISRSPIFPKSQIPFRHKTAPTQNSAKPRSIVQSSGWAQSRRSRSGRRSLATSAGRREINASGNARLRPAAIGPDIKIKDRGRDRHGATRIRNINDAAHPSLDRRRAEDHVGLLAAIAELLEVFDRIETGAAIRDVSVEIVLLACLLIDRDAFKDEVFRESRLERARLEYRIRNSVLGDPTLDEIHANIDIARHFDSAAECDLAVTLRPMNITHRKASSLDIDREVDAGTPREVLDVAIASMLTRG